MIILFILYGSLESASGYHVDLFARHLTKRGHQVTVCHAGSKLSSNKGAYTTITHVELFTNTFQPQPDIIHAWTPREIVRMLCHKVQMKAPDAKLLIHYEDNENVISDACEADIIESQSNLRFYDKERGAAFVEQAHAFTMIVNSLNDIVPINGRPTLDLPATFDDDLFQPSCRNEVLRKDLGIHEDTLTIVYNGNTHRLNQDAVQSVYETAKKLARIQPTVLVRTGLGTRPPPSDGVIDLGTIPRQDSAPLLAIADVFIQPGSSGDFEDYRFPSKVPEMAAIGRPIVAAELPYTALFEGDPILTFCNADPDSLVACIQKMALPAPSNTPYPQGGSRTIRETLHPRVLSEKLAAFYSQVLDKS